MSVTVPLAYPAPIPVGHRVELTWFVKLGGLRGNKPAARPFEPHLRDLDSGVAYAPEWQLRLLRRLPQRRRQRVPARAARRSRGGEHAARPRQRLHRRPRRARWSRTSRRCSCSTRSARGRRSGHRFRVDPLASSHQNAEAGAHALLPPTSRAPRDGRGSRRHRRPGRGGAGGQRRVRRPRHARPADARARRQRLGRAQGRRLRHRPRHTDRRGREIQRREDSTGRSGSSPARTEESGSPSPARFVSFSPEDPVGSATDSAGTGDRDSRRRASASTSAGRCCGPPAESSSSASTTAASSVTIVRESPGWTPAASRSAATDALWIADFGGGADRRGRLATASRERAVRRRRRRSAGGRGRAAARRSPTRTRRTRSAVLATPPGAALRMPTSADRSDRDRARRRQRLVDRELRHQRPHPAHDRRRRHDAQRLQPSTAVRAHRHARHRRHALGLAGDHEKSRARDRGRGAESRSAEKRAAQNRPAAENGAAENDRQNGAAADARSASAERRARACAALVVTAGVDEAATPHRDAPAAGCRQAARRHVREADAQS